MEEFPGIEQGPQLNNSSCARKPCPLDEFSRLWKAKV